MIILKYSLSWRFKIMLQKKQPIYYGTIFVLISINFFIRIFSGIFSGVFALIFLKFLFLIFFIRPRFELNSKNPTRLPTYSYFLIIIIPLIVRILFAFLNLIEPNFWIRTDFWNRTDSFNEFVWETIYAVLLAPILEELLYRGLLLDEQLEHQSERKAIIINTLFFFSLHFNLTSPALLLMSYLLAKSYVKFRSLRLNVLIHLVINLNSRTLQWAMYLHRIEIYYISILILISIVVLFSLFNWLKVKRVSKLENIS